MTPFGFIVISLLVLILITLWAGVAVAMACLLLFAAGVLVWWAFWPFVNEWIGRRRS